MTSQPEGPSISIINEVLDFSGKVQADSVPGLNGISFKLYETYLNVWYQTNATICFGITLLALG